MSVPTPQGHARSTFTPLDLLSGQITLAQAWDLHARQSPNHPLFKYVTAAGIQKEITWLTAVKAFHRVAKLLPSVPADVFAAVKGPTVAILANADSFSYFALITGLMRMGYVPFPVSTRNSAQGVAHLIRTTECHHVFVSKDASMQGLNKAALENLGADYSVEILDMPGFETLYGGVENDPLPEPVVHQDMDGIALILHSSGSTAFPKPIRLAYKILNQWALLPCYGEVDLCAHVLSAHAVPMFHAMGSIQVCWTTATGMTMAAFEPQPIPQIPTPDSVLAAAVGTGSSLVFCVPAFCERWAADESLLPSLQAFKTIIFAGAPMSQLVGDYLVGKGVSLVPFYGATENGCVSIFLPDKCSGKEWQYFRLSPHLYASMIPFNDREDLCELALVESEKHSPSMFNTTIDGRRAYATSDLLERHPVHHNLWKVYGRADDQIMLSTGEKTNPGPIEAIFARDPLIAAAVMFGRGRFQSGILIEPAVDHRFDPSDEEKLTAFRNAIWPTVEKANEYAPQHSRVFKEMIVVTHPDKPFEYTPKAQPRRHVVLAVYEQEIDAAYAAVKEASQADLAAPETWDAAQTTEFVRTVVGRTMKKPVGDDDDIFHHGCDSLQATWIRNTVLRALRQTSKVNTRTLPFAFVYQHPSVSTLSQFLQDTINETHTKKDTDAKTAELEGFVEQFTQNWPAHVPALPQPNAETVLLTGSTGGFGSYILAELINSPAISHIYVLNRAGEAGSKARQVEMIKDRGLDVALLESSKLTILDGDTAADKLGLSADVYEKLKTSVTTVFHNAWRVDFNIVVSSFLPNIKGLRNLIDFSLSSPLAAPPRLLFVSSMGVFRGYHAGVKCPESPIPDARVAAGVGYTESKWVAERILDAAGRNTALKPIVVRLGQVSGGVNGAWSTQEWLPSLVKTSLTLKLVPEGAGVVSWLPAHVAAKAIVEMRTAQVPYLHLVHPQPVPWARVSEALGAKFGAPLVPYAKWLAALETAAEGDAAALPAAKILDFFRGATTDGGPDRETLGFPVLGTREAVRASRTMERLSTDKAMQIGERDVEQWLAYWKSKGYIQV